MSTEITVLDFNLSNIFGESSTYMKAADQQAMFKEMGVNTFYSGQSKEDLKRVTVYLKL